MVINNKNRIMSPGSSGRGPQGLFLQQGMVGIFHKGGGGKGALLSQGKGEGVGWWGSMKPGTGPGKVG